MKRIHLRSISILLLCCLLCHVAVPVCAAVGAGTDSDRQAENPGARIAVGDEGADVMDLQKKLNRIAQRYPQIPVIAEDGQFGSQTENAVRAFQKLFGLHVDGVVGPKTRSELDRVYEELNDNMDGAPQESIRRGDKGQRVSALQTQMNRVSKYYRAIPSLVVDGDFGGNTEAAVHKFQNIFGLKEDGVVGPVTQEKLDRVCRELDALEKAWKEKEGLTEDGHFIAEPERLNGFDFPNDWSRAALEFSVGNGILNGRGDGLAAKENTTRAEMAVILVRLLGAQDLSADLSGFLDASSQAWYYDEMSAAVAMGLVKGTSDSTLEPNEPITREQVCVLLSRAFGLYPSDPSYCDRFSDSGKISDYARSAVSAMAEQGYLNGYSDRTVKPKSYITRAELSKLIYELFTHICDDPDELPLFGRVLYRGADELHVGYTLYGDLTIGCGDRGSLYLCDLNITGALTLRTTPNAQVSLYDNYIGVLRVPAAAELYGNTTVDRLMVGGAGSSIEISADAVYIYADCVLVSDCKRVDCVEPGLTVTVEGDAESLRLSADGLQVKVSGTVNSCAITRNDAVLTVEGTVADCQIRGDNVVLKGSGKAKNVEIYGVGHSISLKCTNLKDHVWINDYESALSTVKTVDDWNKFVADKPYSQATMEGFVNTMGYSSDTQWLVWTSTKTLTVNVFTGIKGNWTLVRTMPCAMGKPSTPTIKGEYTVCYKDDVWEFKHYNCRWVTHFVGGYAFHSRPWSLDYSYLVDDSMSTLVSAGCIRMLDEDCYYIYKNVPVNSTVLVY